MRKKASFAAALVLSALSAFSQAEAGGLVEGEGWAFLASAPAGWVWDGASLRHQGIQGLYYKEGADFSPSGLHMYISPSPKRPGGAADLGAFIQGDEAAFMRAAPGSGIRELGAYSSSIDYRFALRDFDDPIEGYYHAIAYYEGDRAYFVFVLLCRSAAERDRERSSFRELLDSFTYIRKE